jgi:hypothetical protein
MKYEIKKSEYSGDHDFEGSEIIFTTTGWQQAFTQFLIAVLETEHCWASKTENVELLADGKRIARTDICRLPYFDFAGLQQQLKGA